MRLYLAIALTASLLNTPSPTFAQAAPVQEEAEREMKEVDCAILTFSTDLESIGNEMRSILSEMSAVSKKSTEAQGDAIFNAVKLVSTVTFNIVELNTELTEAMRTERAKKGEKRSKKSARASKTSGVISKIPSALLIHLKNIEVATEILETYISSSEIEPLVEEHVRIGARLQEASERQARAEKVIATLNRSRENTQAKWEQRGAIVEGFYGDDCVASQFDGVWQTEYRQFGLQENEDVVEIRGNTFFFESGTSGVTENCGRFQSVLNFPNSNSATTTVKHHCGGLNVHMKFAFALESGQLTMNHCQVFSYNPDSCEIANAGADQLPVPLVKVSD